MLSLPSRERGLKFISKETEVSKLESLPSRERGLKFNISYLINIMFQSLPSRERGLKLVDSKTAVTLDCRSLRGSVD